MADQKNAVPAQTPPAAKPAHAYRNRPSRNPGWCVAANLEAGQTLQDVPRDKILESAAAHEAKWKGRFNAQQKAAQANMDWHRG